MVVADGSVTASPGGGSIRLRLLDWKYSRPSMGLLRWLHTRVVVLGVFASEIAARG